MAEGRRGRDHDGDHKRGHGGHRGTRYVWGGSYVYYFFDGYYHGDCDWLRVKARETGSRYWRERYELCREED